ncbi:MAG: transketolase [Bacilli bacterium]|nr:transketolase [Bacilli bacterium]MDY6430650.1 transketolase [Bacilli bacterium]
MSKQMSKKEKEKLVSGAIRSLVIDQTNQANSGHPGMALDSANILYALYRDHLVASPSHPEWINRDRLVYSCGHTSALVYAMLHLCGYELSMDDLKSFRQLGSKTPGHPEISLTKGIDASSGPLGQGIAQALGMAIAEKHLEAKYPEGKKIMNHYTYCICGDGCLEEGISQEAISLAGHLRLNKFILIYDENGSTLDGPTSNSLTENMELRFLASEWLTIKVKDGNNINEISRAIKKAKKSAYPTLIIVKTKIGYGTVLEGSNKVHGSPLGEENGAKAKEVYGYNHPKFTVPAEVYEEFKQTFIARGEEAYKAHIVELNKYRNSHPSEYKVFMDSFDRNVDPYLENISIELKDEASRESSGRMLEALTKNVPFMFGGSADVASSTKTNVKGLKDFSSLTPEGNNMNWGIREFVMAAANNGILLHGGLVTYEGLFLIFADYMKPAIRMGAIEDLPAIYVFTHDSISVGEDGLTHEPIEQIASLRSIPNFIDIRPADNKETIGAYKLALKEKKSPIGLILSRQKLPLLDETDEKKVQFGAYKVREHKDDKYLIIATGSEVNLALEAAKRIEEERNIHVGVVSMPSMNLFEKQSEEYKKLVLSLPREKTISLEMAATFGWERYAKFNLGINSFGASGKEKDVLKYFGFDLDGTTKKLLDIIDHDNEEIKPAKVESKKEEKPLETAKVEEKPLKEEKKEKKPYRILLVKREEQI